MEDAFQDLFRLIDEASLALDRDCIVTVRAYLKMAEAATVKLPAHAKDKKEEKRLRAVCNYSAKFCFRRKKWEDVVGFMIDFWMGVEDGFFERTFVSNGGKYYERGYKLAQHNP